jgi:glycosyltransferase involved in cell wall biosynthesis
MKTARALVELGHRVTLIIGRTASRTELLEYYGVSDHPELEVVQLPVLRRRSWPRLSWHAVYNVSCLVTLAAIWGRDPWDVLHLSDLKLARFLLRWTRRRTCPWIYEVHGLRSFRDPSRGIELDPIEGEVFAATDQMVATTRVLGQILEHKCGVRRPIAVVPLATDLAGVVTGAPRSPGPPRVFYVGQLYPLQGVDLFLEALGDLPQVEGDVVGGRPEQVASLRRLAEELGMASRVRFHGFVRPADLSHLVRDADLFVLPARAEGKMPYVGHVKLYEYMAWGRPIVAADLPAVREDLRDEENGLLVPAGDPKGLAGAIRRILEDGELAARVGARAREAARHYTYQARAARLVEVYRQVLRTQTDA